MQLSAFKECVKKQNGGFPFPLGTATYTLRRWGTKESERFLVSLRRELYGAFSDSPEYFPEVIAHWLAGYGVMDWEGVMQDDGELIPHTEAAARQVFLDQSYWLSLNMELFAAAQKFDNFLEDIAKEDAEDLKK